MKCKTVPDPSTGNKIFTFLHNFFSVKAADMNQLEKNDINSNVNDIIHLLDSAEPDIRFVVQIEADVGRSEAESNISLDLQQIEC